MIHARRRALDLPIRPVRRGSRCSIWGNRRHRVKCASALAEACLLSAGASGAMPLAVRFGTPSVARWVRGEWDRHDGRAGRSCRSVDDGAAGDALGERDAATGRHRRWPARCLPSAVGRTGRSGAPRRCSRRGRPATAASPSSIPEVTVPVRLGMATRATTASATTRAPERAAEPAGGVVCGALGTFDPLAQRRPAVVRGLDLAGPGPRAGAGR